MLRNAFRSCRMLCEHTDISAASSTLQLSWLSSSFTTTAAAAAAGPSNKPLAAPWVPTSQLIKRKTHQKRARHLIQTLEQEQVQQLQQGKELPDFRSGDILEVTTVVPEADRKQYTYKGVCIARSNKGPRSWFKVYNVFPDVGGFVQHFPLYMPDLVGVKVVGRLPRAKRSKLYHLLQDEGPKHIYQASIAQPK
jgi:large subunit ribosomal protein L19